MSADMDERFASALRELLVAQVQAESATRSWSRWLRRRSARVGFVIGVLASGSGIAAAADAVLSSGPPGSQQVTALAAPITASGDGRQTVQLPRRPADANALYYELSCLTPGSFTFDDGSGLTCGDQADVASSLVHPVSGTILLGPNDASVTINAVPGDRWRLTVLYANATTTPWKVNASGQTYGTPNSNGAPDLVAAIASNGQSGYVYTSQLVGPQPSTPTQAATSNQAARTITVYESDGTTPIGQFVVGQ